MCPVVVMFERPQAQAQHYLPFTQNLHLIADHLELFKLILLMSVCCSKPCCHCLMEMSLKIRYALSTCICVILQVSWRKVCLVLHEHRGRLGHRARPAAAQTCHYDVCLTVGVCWWCSSLKNKEHSSHLVQCCCCCIPITVTPVSVYSYFAHWPITVLAPFSSAPFLVTIFVHVLYSPPTPICCRFHNLCLLRFQRCCRMAI